MTLNQLVCRAASAYPEAFVMEYWSQASEKPMAYPEGGDTLAEFIARELYESFDPEAGDDEQLATAVKVMQSAADDLQAVAHALANIGRERMAA
jgi:hypothetical protein